MVIACLPLQLRLLPPLDLPNLQPVHGLFLRLLLPLMSLLLPAAAAEECQTVQHHQVAVVAVAELSLQLECR
jgi:hypothetical protein